MVEGEAGQDDRAGVPGSGVVDAGQPLGGGLLVPRHCVAPWVHLLGDVVLDGGVGAALPAPLVAHHVVEVALEEGGRKISELSELSKQTINPSYKK